MNEIIKLYIFDLKELKDDIEIPYLTNEDIENANKYKTIISRKQHLISSYLKRRFVGDYLVNGDGKPYSATSFFNISHSNEYVVLAISDKHPIGVDIEEIKEVKDDMRKYISSKEEYLYIKNDKNFFEVWTSKESLSKAYGTGLYDIKNIPALPLDGVKIYQNKKYRSNIIYLDNYVLSITIESENNISIQKEEVTI